MSSLNTLSTTVISPSLPSPRRRIARSHRATVQTFAPVIRGTKKSLRDVGLDLLDPKASRRPILPGPSSHHLGAAGDNLGKIHRLKHQAVRHQLFAGMHQDAQYASIITTPTYSAHPRLAREDTSFPEQFRSLDALNEELFLLNNTAVDIAHQVRASLGSQHLIFGSFGTSGDGHQVIGQLEGSEGKLIDQYSQDHLSQLLGLTRGEHAVDALFFEAAGVSIPELIAVAQLCKSLSVPLLISCVVNDAGELLDPHNTDDFHQIESSLRKILGRLLLGLSINCSPRGAIMKAFEKDTYGVLRGAHQNEGEYTDAELAAGSFGEAQSIAADMQWKAQLYAERPDLSYGGRCCSSGENDQAYSAAERFHFEKKTT